MMLENVLLDEIGFVSLEDSMGDDLKPVNMAKGSYGKKVGTLDEKGKHLIDYLTAQNPQHTAPFRHVQITLHVKAPELVARQWYKHVIGGEYAFKDQPWSEISQRYVELSEEFYIPREMRRQATKNKQASEGGFDEKTNAELRDLYTDSLTVAFVNYKRLLAAGVAREIARGVIPISCYTEWYWTASLQTLAHFVILRDHPHAQWEIQRYAEGVDAIARSVAPLGFSALVDKVRRALDL